MHIALGPAAQNIVYNVFDPGLPVQFHLPKITPESPPLLYVIQQDRHCMSTSDFYFTNIKPESIIIPTHWENNSPPAEDQAGARDPTHQEADSLQPEETCIYPWMLSSTQVPVLDLTNTKVTSTSDLEQAFHTLNLCPRNIEEDSHGRKDTTKEN